MLEYRTPEYCIAVYDAVTGYVYRYNTRYININVVLSSMKWGDFIFLHEG